MMHNWQPSLTNPVGIAAPWRRCEQRSFQGLGTTGAVESQALVTECVSNQEQRQPARRHGPGIGGGGNENCHDYTCVCFHHRVNLRDKLWFGISCSKHANQDRNHVPHRFRVGNTVGYADLQDKEWMMATFELLSFSIVVWAVVAGPLLAAKAMIRAMAR